jgi:signal transduction histidine kinase
MSPLQSDADKAKADLANADASRQTTEPDDEARSGWFMNNLSTILRIIWPITLILGLAAVAAGIYIGIATTAHKTGLEQITVTGNTRAQLTKVLNLAQKYDKKPGDHSQKIQTLDSELVAASKAHQKLKTSSQNTLPQYFDGQDRLDQVMDSLTFSLGQMQRELRIATETVDNQPGRFSLTPEKAVERLIAHGRDYLILLDHIDLRVAQSASDQIGRLQIVGAGVVGLLGVCLIVLSTLVLLPSHRAIERQIDRLKHHRRQLAEATIAAERMVLARESLLRGLSHDVRAPLQTILLNLEIANQRGAPEVFGDEIDYIERSAGRISEIIESLLRDRLTQQDVSDHPVEIGPLIAGVVSEFEALANERGLTLHNEAEPNLPGLTIPRHALERALQNLVSNALKYTEQGRVDVLARHHTTDSREFIAIDVSDTGPGIPNELLREAFTTGRRLTESGEGHGLGLAIARGLVQDELSGELLVDTQPGEGATFTIMLPVEDDIAEDDPTWSFEDFTQRLRETKVFENLVVYAVGIPDLDELTEPFGLSVQHVAAENASEQISEQLDKETRSVVIFDADELPEAGVSCCQAADAAGDNLKAIGVYSDTTAISRSGLLQAGCSRLIRKPIEPIELLDALVAIMV